MTRWKRWLLMPVATAALALAGCGGDEGGGPGTGSGTGTGTGGEWQLPEGNDNIVELANVEGAQGVLYQAMAIHQGHIFACTAGHGLHVVKIVGPDKLQTVAQAAAFPDGTGCREITLSDDGTLFITGQSTSQPGSWIVAVDPASLLSGSDSVTPLSSVHIEGLIQDMVASASHLYVVLGESGLVVYGRNDGELAEVGRLQSGFDQALGVDLYGDNRLVVANGLSGSLVIDVTDPASPSIDKPIDAFGTARRVRVQGDYAYVAGVASGLAIMDLTKASNHRVSVWVTYGSTLDLALDGSLIYAANWEDMVILDASDPANIQLAGSELIVPSDGSAPHVVTVRTADGFAYAAEWTSLRAFGMGLDRAAADIRLSRTRVDFGLVNLKKGKGIIIDNLGDEALEITDVSIDKDVFSYTLDDMTVQPGDKTYLQVVIEPVDDQEVRGTLTMTTNDPDEGIVTLPLVANALDGVQVGGAFEGQNEFIYKDHKTGNDVTLKQNHPGKVAILAYFATW